MLFVSRFFLLPRRSRDFLLFRLRWLGFLFMLWRLSLFLAARVHFWLSGRGGSSRGLFGCS